MNDIPQLVLVVLNYIVLATNVTNTSALVGALREGLRATEPCMVLVRLNDYYYYYYYYDYNYKYMYKYKYKYNYKY